MNVTFSRVDGTNRSIYFAASNDGKIINFNRADAVILVAGAGGYGNIFNGTYKNYSGEMYQNRLLYRKTDQTNYIIRRGQYSADVDSWFIGIEDTWSPPYYNLTNGQPWDGNWQNVPFGPSPAPIVTRI